MGNGSGHSETVRQYLDVGEERLPEELMLTVSREDMESRDWLSYSSGWDTARSRGSSEISDKLQKSGSSNCNRRSPWSCNFSLITSMRASTVSGTWDSWTRHASSFEITTRSSSAYETQKIINVQSSTTMIFSYKDLFQEYLPFSVFNTNRRSVSPNALLQQNKLSKDSNEFISIKNTYFSIVTVFNFKWPIMFKEPGS